ncbi:hypothetical protein Tco_1146817 [Tanacetum coccineum]
MRMWEIKNQAILSGKGTMLFWGVIEYGNSWVPILSTALTQVHSTAIKDDCAFNLLKKSTSSNKTYYTGTLGVSTGTLKVTTASAELVTASFGDATAICPFCLSTQRISNLFIDDLEQIHDDDLEEDGI